MEEFEYKPEPNKQDGTYDPYLDNAFTVVMETIDQVGGEDNIESICQDAAEAFKVDAEELAELVRAETIKLAKQRAIIITALQTITD